MEIQFDDLEKNFEKMALENMRILYCIPRWKS